jgi:hypothetical protein
VESDGVKEIRKDLSGIKDCLANIRERLAKLEERGRLIHPEVNKNEY